MEKKKKKKFTLKKVKKLFGEMWKSAFDLPAHLKIICGIWVGVFIIIVLVIYLGSSSKVFVEEYKNLETSMSNAAIKYANKEDLTGTKEEPLYVPLDILNSQVGFDDKDLNEKSCIGFSLVYYDDETKGNVADSYISCEKYVTKGYDKNK